MRINYFDNPTTRMEYKMVNGTETSSKEVKYLPFYVLDNYISYSSNIYIGVKDTIIFGLPNIKNTLVKRSFTYIPHYLQAHSNFLTKLTYKELTIYVGKGLVMDEFGRILFLMVADSEKHTNPEYDKMFVASAFYQPQYKTVYKKVFDSLIFPALEEGVRMEVMPSIEIKDTVYKSLTPTINDFQSIDEYNEQIRAAIEKGFLKEEEILVPVRRDKGETLALINEMTDYEYGKFVTEACSFKMLDEIWELYQKSDNAFIPSENIVLYYIREYKDRLEWVKSETIEEDEDEMVFGHQPLASELIESLDGILPLTRVEATSPIDEIIGEGSYTSPRGSGIFEQMMTAEASAHQALTPEIVESVVERIFAGRPEIGTVTTGIDPAGVAPTSTQVLRGVVSSSDEEAPF